MKYTKEISNQLNALQEKNFDAKKGYLKASETIDSHKLSIYLERMAKEREEFAKEIRIEMLRNGEELRDPESDRGASFRDWDSLESKMSTDENLILEEIIKGEEASLNDYYALMIDRRLPPSIDALLFRQQEAIKVTLESVKAHEGLVV